MNEANCSLGGVNPTSCAPKAPKGRIEIQEVENGYVVYSQYPYQTKIASTMADVVAILNGIKKL